MALPVYQAAGATAESAGAVGTAVNPAWPTHQAGDIGLLIVEHSGWGLNIPTPAGFKEVPSSPQTSGSGNDQGTQLSVFWKRATSGAEGAPTVKTGYRWRSFGGTEDLALKAKIITIRGCGATGNPWNITAGSNTYESASTSVSIPGGTTTDNDCLIVLIASNAFADTTTPQFSGWTNAALANLTERIDDQSTIGLGSGIAVATGEKAVAGSFGATTATLATSGAHSHIMLAMTPVATTDDTTPYLVTVGIPVELAAAGSITPAWPEGHLTNDIGILIVLSGGWPVATPSGWTAVASSPQLGGVSGAADATGLHVYWKRAASGAEAAPSIAFVASQIQGVIATVRGVPASGTPQVVEAGDTAASSTAVSMPSVTTTKPNTMILQILGHTLDSASRGSNPSTWSNSSLDEFNYHTAYPSVIGSGSNINVFKGKKKAAGSIGNTTGTLDFTQRQARITLGFSISQQILVMDTGVFTQSGKVMLLLRSRLIAMAAGAFVQAGQDITFSIILNKLLTMLTGIFVQEGQPITFAIKKGRWEIQATKSNLWTKRPRIK